jgi:hypothetical protein
VIEYLATLGAGLFLEGTAVFWTHYSERGNAAVAALFSGVQAIALVFGVGESVQNSKHAPFFVLGYAGGSYLAIKIKDRFKTLEKD